METREQAVERLKENWLPWCRLSKSDKDFFNEHREHVMRLRTDGSWNIYRNCPIDANDILHISPDYQPEPAKPEDKYEKVYGENGMLFVNVPGMYGRCLIESLVHYEDFRGFYDAQYGDRVEVQLDQVARRRAEGRKVVAKFEKGK